MCPDAHNPLFFYYHLLVAHCILARFSYICAMAKKVPQRRNSNAGKSTGKSKSAKYFASNPEARAKKNAYNKAYHATPERKKYRADLNKANKDSPNSKGTDKSHTKSGKLTNEKRSTNRARNGKGGSAKRK